MYTPSKTEEKELLIGSALWELWGIRLKKSKPSEYLATLPFEQQQQVKEFLA